VEAEIAGTVGLLPGLTLTPMYTYTHKFQDQFRGDRGFNYGQLQAETAGDLHTLDKYMESRYLKLSEWQRRQRRAQGKGNYLYVRYADDCAPRRREGVCMT